MRVLQDLDMMLKSRRNTNSIIAVLVTYYADSELSPGNL
jgi:hypothetical protein